MADFPNNPTDGVEPTIADEVTDSSMVPMDDAAGGPQADTNEDKPDQMNEKDGAHFGAKV